MNMRSRILVVLASITLIALYFFPLWQINLEAPQYPEGLGMKIFISDVRGASEFDLDNINRLNHYIGMKEIKADAIPELKFMPYCVVFLIAVGLLAALIGKKKFLALWLFLFLGLGAAGLADFYKWNYDYGHNLNPHAPIKVPGMSYQPPVFGTKQLLNMTTHSYPDLGGIAAGVAFILGTLAMFGAKKKNFSEEKVAEKAKIFTAKNATAAASIFVVFAFISCTPAPEAIYYGKDNCSDCKMMISDQRFGAELVTKTGKVYKFDAVECLVHFMKKENFPEEKIFQLLVVDFSNPGHLIPAKEANFLHTEKISSPMGLNVSAFSSKEKFHQTKDQFGGDMRTWSEVRALAEAQ